MKLQIQSIFRCYNPDGTIFHVGILIDGENELFAILNPECGKTTTECVKAFWDVSQDIFFTAGSHRNWFNVFDYIFRGKMIACTYFMGGYLVHNVISDDDVIGG